MKENGMEQSIDINRIYVRSDDVVAREIEGELIIVPLTAGIGNMEDELYTLNETGKAIWDRLDGHHTLRQVIGELAEEYAAPSEDITHDVAGLVGELVQRKILQVL